MHSLISNQYTQHITQLVGKNFQNTLKLYFKCCVTEMYYYFSNNFTKITLLEIFSRVCIFWWLNPLVSKPCSVTESNSHDAVVNLKSKTMKLKNLKIVENLPRNISPWKNLARKLFFLQDSCKMSCRKMHYLARP